MILFGKLTLLLFNLVLNNMIIVIALIFIIFSLRSRFKKATFNNVCNIKTPDSKVIDSTAPQKYDAEVIIIGSGILGSVMAASLGKLGYRIIVIEKDLREPSRIVGELMQPGGVEALANLGLESALEGIDAQSSRGYKVHNNALGSSIILPYGRNECGDIVTGKAFHHGRLVQNLRRASDCFNNVQKIEGDAVKLIKQGGVVIGVEYKDSQTSKPKPLYGRLTIVADGCFSKFRKHLLPPGTQPQVKSYFVGILIENVKTLVEPGPETVSEDPYYAEVVLADPSVILIYKISSLHTRILIDVPSPLPNDLRNYLQTNIAPQLPVGYRANFERALSEVFDRRTHNQSRSSPTPPVSEATDGNGGGAALARFKVMPNSYLCTGQPDTPGAITLGDAFNMRHPLTGGGMTVALNDAIFWSRELRDNNLLNPRHRADTNTTLSAARKRFARARSFGYSFAVNVLAQALYALFASGHDKYLKVLREACFHYFQMGGICISGPMGIISITNAKPHLLIGHFFAVAFYAIYRCFTSIADQQKNMISRLTSYLANVPFCLGLLCKSCHIIVPLVWNEIKSTIAF